MWLGVLHWIRYDDLFFPSLSAPLPGSEKRKRGEENTEKSVFLTELVLLLQFLQSERRCGLLACHGPSDAGSVTGCCCWLLFSCSVMSNSLAYQAPLSMRFSQEEYRSGLPFPSPEALSGPGVKPAPPALQADSLPLSHQGDVGSSRDTTKYHSHT